MEVLIQLVAKLVVFCIPLSIAAVVAYFVIKKAVKNGLKEYHEETHH